MGLHSGLEVGTGTNDCGHAHLLLSPAQLLASLSYGAASILSLPLQVQGWRDECGEGVGAASPAHIQLQGGLGVGGHDPRGHAEGHALCEEGHLGQGLGRGGGWAVRTQWPLGSPGLPSPATSNLVPQAPAKVARTLASSRLTLRETTPGKSASGKASPSTWNRTSCSPGCRSTS